jgi:CRP-like cAMP-binding protein
MTHRVDFGRHAALCGNARTLLILFDNVVFDDAMTSGVLKAKMPILNRLLAAIPPNEYERLRPKMAAVKLRFGTVIYDAGGQIEHVYFPNSGVISLLTGVDGSATVDVGMVGHEGVVGLSAFLGKTISAGRAIVLVEGTAIRVAVSDLADICPTGGVLQLAVLRFVRSMLVQVSKSAACYRFHAVKNRLARFLLMVTDRTGSDEIGMTQVFLSSMLGARREAVNKAAASLRAKGLIDNDRAYIRIIDRPGLEAVACECYESIRAEERSFPAFVTPSVAAAKT